MKNICSSLKPGGILAVEDVDFKGSFSYPACPAYDKYVECYEKAGKLKGANPLIGPSLPALFKEAGFSEIRFQIFHPCHSKGIEKTIHALTLDNISQALVELKLIEQATVKKFSEELWDFTRREDTILGLPRIWQVYGVK